MSTNGIVFDVQRFCIHDGPGIRTVIFFKGCPLRCRWCQNPEGLDPRPEISFSRGRCVGCRECQKACPLEAITFEGVGRIDRRRCDRCGKCTEVCYTDALQIVGKSYTAAQLLEEAMDDMPFFLNSGGGITLSGGEPTYQAGFLASFLPLCREAGLHVALETCGHVAYEVFGPLLPLVDLILYDIKAVDSALHRKLTGIDNELILGNVERVLEEHASKVIVRVPLTPDLTATDKNLNDIASFLGRHSISEVTLLPYHRMGEGKLDKIESPLRPLHLAELTDRDLKRVSILFRNAGIQAIV